MTTRNAPERLVGSSPAMAKLRRFIELAAGSDVPVLIQGETGTGKTMVARMIHAASAREANPFVAINCAGMPEALFESEMFGHRKGAFTGAVSARDGLMVAAGGGTLFLDEVGDLPLGQQAKLLTVVEERRVRRVGDDQLRAVNCRLVAATGKDLLGCVREGTFRRDLLHRLTVLRFVIPPLRDRPEDLEGLVARLLKKLARRYQRPGLRLSPDAWALVRSHPWPGNVREVDHVLEGTTILTEGPEVSGADLEAVLLNATP